MVTLQASIRSEMTMEYVSTRGEAAPLDFNGVLMQGLAADGGLYVPRAWPTPPATWPKEFNAIMVEVLNLFGAGVDAALIKSVYDNFRSTDVTPLVPFPKADPRLHVLELFHGPTMAFKDIALQLLGPLIDRAAGRSKITVLGATSGDTGSAAMAGCMGCQNLEAFILYPHNRPSEVQRRQMTTLGVPNIHALAINGTFDDCQNIVKQLFLDPALRERKKLVAVNSINWARILPQVVYYIYAAQKFGGTPVRFIVPTGNFGNIYAGYVAKLMGAPIKQLVVASNANDVLPRFFNTGTMSLKPVLKTLSPSMDIQVSSNFERLHYDLVNHNPALIRFAMKQLRDKGSFTVPPDVIAKAGTVIKAVAVDDTKTHATMRRYAGLGLLVDPHTAVGLTVADQILAANPKDDTPTISLACAAPAKFIETVEASTGKNVPLPRAIQALLTRPEKFEILAPEAESVKAFMLS